jgi:hypothetical protein
MTTKHCKASTVLILREREPTKSKVMQLFLKTGQIPFERTLVLLGVDIRYDKMLGNSQNIEKNTSFIESRSPNDEASKASRSYSQW